MKRDDFKMLSKLRRSEAKVLLDAGKYPGAYYLMGYSVECALKACIAKLVERYDFPQRDTRDIYCHDLQKLLRSANLEAAYRAAVLHMPALAVNWATVKDWSEEQRYRVQPITKVETKDYYRACTARNNGVLTWIAKQW